MCMICNTELSYEIHMVRTSYKIMTTTFSLQKTSPLLRQAYQLIHVTIISLENAVNYPPQVSDSAFLFDCMQKTTL